MPLASCVRCKKMFNKVKSPVCPSCQTDEDSDFDKIHKVLGENEHLSAEQVAEAAGVDVVVVRRMVDEGLVSQVSLGESAVCGQCGAPAISLSKKLCQACLDKLNAGVAKAQAQIKLGQKKATQIGEYGTARKTFEDKRK